MIKKINNKKILFLIKVILPSLLFLIMLLSLFSLSNNETIINNLSKVFYEENEVELDNWEISTVFYDSTVDDGKTPLTDINWDASDGGCDTGETRTITIQINYKNSNAVQEYKPGDLKISFSNLLYSNTAQWSTTIILGANDGSHSGYDWTFEPYYNNANSYLAEASSAQKEYSFVNANTIEKYSNLEGTIQVTYILTPKKEENDTYWGNAMVERYKEECLHEFKKNISSFLKSNKETINSNELSFSYRRLYFHPWTHRYYSFTRIPYQLTSVDGLPSNYKDYYWVKYDANGTNSFDNSYSTHYPSVGVKLYIEEEFCEECIVLDEQGNEMSPDSNNKYRSNKEYIIVGYPKSKYNVENNNMVIENEAILYGDYLDGTTHEYQSKDTRSIDLNKYEINILGDLYSFDKIIAGRPYYQKIFYENLIGKDTELRRKGIVSSTLNPIIKYNGEKYDLIIGDDLLFILGEDNKYKKLKQGEYYFNEIIFPNSFKNGNSQDIEDEKYDVELYVKRGNNDYELFTSFKNNGYKDFTFSKEDNVSAFYFKIKNLKEGIINLPIGVESTINNAHDIPYEGTIMNLGFMQVYIDNEMQNPVTDYDFPEEVPKDVIEDYDMNEYGKKIHRDYATVNYYKYEGPKPDEYYFSILKRMSPFSQNEKEFKFDTENTIYIGGTNFTTLDLPIYEIKKYAHEIDEKYKVEGWNVYDLLPEGMKLESSKNEILNSIFIHRYGNSETSNRTSIFFDADGNFIDRNAFLNIVKENSSIKIINNYKNTNRTYIQLKIDLSKNPLIYAYEDSYSDYMEMCFLGFKYKSSVSYDSYLTYGNNWKNRAYINYLNKTSDEVIQYLYKDDGLSLYGIDQDINEADIDDDGIKEEGINKTQTENTILPIVSTHQDLQTSVQSDLSNFDTGKVDVSTNNTYTYKLRARTGTNDVTNLVIYDSLENYAKDSNMEFIDSAKGYHKWRGEFQGIDTTFAESKGYIVRTYYSEKDKPGNLKDDNSWILYTDSVDKTKVKSLAFEYLDNNGNPAILPANSLTYVLVKMKSPSNENIKTLAYNGCWTEWNAIDSLTGRPVDFITGINSNIVKVALPNSVEPQDIDLEINKYWNDSNNKLGIRPSSTTIQVVPDGDLTKAIDVPLGENNIDSNDSNHWRTTISVPKTDLDGNTISYTFRENEIILDNNYKYIPSIDNNSITNTLFKEIELKKIWKDNTNAYLTRPSNITYHIKQNNNSYKDITFTGDYSTNEWTKKIIVPVFDNSYKEYQYTIEEDSINNYISDCNDYTCINTLSSNDTLNIKKNWVDNNNIYNTRPNNIKINILQNNNTYKGITLSSNDNWTNAITVPKYDSNGVKYHYTIEEEQINEYDLVEYNQNNYTVTNTLKTNINLTITKNWIDDNNSNNTRPNELKITLLQNNNEYKELTLSGDTNTWTTTIEVPKYDNNQKEYKYSIREITDNLNSDYSDITYSEEELSVTNKLNKKQDLIIKKKWIDEDNKYLTRPDSVNINLLRDNEIYRTITLTGENNTWVTTINDIDVYDPNGKKYNYTLEEENLEKYGKVTYNNADLEITNELTEIPKVTLYFTVVNGYVDPITKEIKYDDFGLDEIMKKYNVNPEDEYIFKFELQNIKTGKIYDGKLSTKGILEFDDLPYGEYKAVEGEDKLFKFVDMLEIEEVNGVKFEKRGNEGFITIKPTGENIIYGAKIINKIEAPIVNPKTHMKGLFLVLTIILVTVLSFIIVRKRKELYN